eukprot:2031528-Rhodomonas_salina.6
MKALPLSAAPIPDGPQPKAQANIKKMGMLKTMRMLLETKKLPGGPAKWLKNNPLQLPRTTRWGWALGCLWRFFLVGVVATVSVAQGVGAHVVSSGMSLGEGTGVTPPL